MVDLKERRNLYVTCAAPGSFHDASKKSHIFSWHRSNKVSGKPPAILLLLASRSNGKGKQVASSILRASSSRVRSSFVFFFLHNIVKIYLFDFQEISLSSSVVSFMIIVIVIIIINLNQLIYHQNNGKLCERTIPLHATPRLRDHSFERNF